MTTGKLIFHFCVEECTTHSLADVFQCPSEDDVKFDMERLAC